MQGVGAICMEATVVVQEGKEVPLTMSHHDPLIKLTQDGSLQKMQASGLILKSTPADRPLFTLARHKGWWFVDAACYELGQD